MKRKSFFKSLVGLAVAPLLPGIAKGVEKHDIPGNTPLSSDIVVLNTCEGNALSSIEVREDAGLVQHDLISVGDHLYYVLMAEDYGCLSTKTNEFSNFQRIRLRMVNPAPYQIKVGDKVKVMSMAFGEHLK